MENQDNMSAERSLEIITEMMENTRKRIMKDAWKPMFCWGVATTIIAVAVYFIWKFTGNSWANCLWALICLLFFIRFPKSEGSGTIPDNTLSKGIGQVWKNFGILAVTMSIIIGIIYIILAIYSSKSQLSGLSEQARMAYVALFSSIVAIYALLGGMATMITGGMLKSGVIQICGFITAVAGSIVSYMFHGPEQMLVLAGCFIVVLIIPSLVIRNQTESC
jgi:hypothetical protein